MSTIRPLLVQIGGGGELVALGRSDRPDLSDEALFQQVLGVTERLVESASQAEIWSVPSQCPSVARQSREDTKEWLT